jgi:hypothetical protein
MQVLDGEQTASEKRTADASEGKGFVPLRIERIL